MTLMLGTGRIIRRVATVSTNGATETSTMANGNIRSSMGKEQSSSPMETRIQDSMRMANLTAMDNINGERELSTSESSWRDRNMAKESG